MTRRVHMDESADAWRDGGLDAYNSDNAANDAYEFANRGFFNPSRANTMTVPKGTAAKIRYSRFTGMQMPNHKGKL